MLQAIRERSQGLIVAIITGFIILTFALWGVESYISDGRRVVVAEVEGEEIYLTEFQENLQRMRRQAQSVLGDSFDEGDWNTEAFKQRALDQLVNDRIVAALLDDSRILVSDQQVARQVREIPAFQDEEGFSRLLYEQRLPQLGLTQAGFERDLRNDMGKAQLRAGIAASEFVTREEAGRVQRLREQKRDIGYAIIPASEYDDALELTNKALSEYYEANRESYRRPERVRLEYLVISPADLEDDVLVNEDALRTYYDENQGAYTVEEQRNVNHILINLAQDADEAAHDAALAKAQKALERARAGEDFEALATELSDDVGSRTEGGETGMFPRGVMAPEFEQAAFELEVGGVSEPVKTRFGYHIIKLKAVEPGGLQSYEDVREQVEAAYRSEQAERRFFDQAELFSNLVYEHPDSLDVAAETLGLEKVETELLTATQLTTLFSERVAARAFDAEVLVERLNAEPIDLPDGRVVAIRVAEHEPSVIPPFEEVSAAVREDLARETRRTRTVTTGQAMIEALRGGATVEDVVTAEGFDWKEVKGATRDSDDANRAVLRAAFRTATTGDGPNYTGVPIGQTDYAVNRIDRLSTPPADDVSDADVRQVQVDVLNSRSGLVWEEFISALRERADVKIYAHNL